MRKISTKLARFMAGCLATVMTVGSGLCAPGV